MLIGCIIHIDVGLIPTWVKSVNIYIYIVFDYYNFIWSDFYGFSNNQKKNL